MADEMQELMARRPTQELVVTLSDNVVEEYQAQGYTSVSRITTDEEVEWLREVYDLFFSGELNLPKGALVNDIIYIPRETPLIEAARKRGNRTVTGLGMLLHQGIPAWKAWFGIEPKVTAELRAKIEATL